jgi:hypothetical protein
MRQTRTLKCASDGLCTPVDRYKKEILKGIGARQKTDGVNAGLCGQRLTDPKKERGSDGFVPVAARKLHTGRKLYGVHLHHHDCHNVFFQKKKS